MEILIRENTQADTGTKGYAVQFIAQQGKRRVDESDFFPDGSEIETIIQQLRKQLRKYFDANH